MIRRYSRLSNALGSLGVLLAVGSMMAMASHAVGEYLGLLLMVAGYGSFLVGVVYYAKAKGRHPCWGLVGVFLCFGLLILMWFKDRSGEMVQVSDILEDNLPLAPRPETGNPYQAP